MARLQGTDCGRDKEAIFLICFLLLYTKGKQRAMMDGWADCNALERSPEKVSGAWIFRNTRVPVTAFFENLKDGASVEEFLDWFPGVTRSQVESVLEHEIQTLAHSASA